MPPNDSVMRGLKRSARRKQAFFEHPKATRRRARSPKVRRRTDSSRGELSRNLTGRPVNFRTECSWSAMRPRIAFMICRKVCLRDDR